MVCRLHGATGRTTHAKWPALGEYSVKQTVVQTDRNDIGPKESLLRQEARFLLPQTIIIVCALDAVGETQRERYSGRRLHLVCQNI